MVRGEQAPMNATKPEGRTISPSSSATRAENKDTQARADRAFLGHPRGLATLFNLELWERFSYLGFQAILALYFASAISQGGLGYEESTASSIVAAYGALVYLLSIAGAWIADRVSGTHHAVLWGGIIIAAGHIAMGVPTEVFTWVGLALIIVGTGLLKPNVSTMVGELYEKGDQRRDAGFSIYYSGINIGAFLGPLIAGWLGQTYNWHYGFAAAAVGMIAGVIQFIAGGKYLAGRKKGEEIRAAFRADKHFFTTVGLVAAAVVVAVVFAVSSRDSLGTLVNLVTIVTILVPFFYLVMMSRSSQVTQAEKKNLFPYSLLLVALVMYNLTYFQTGNTLNFLALDKTNNSIGSFTYPSTWYISLTAIVEIVMGPALAWLWVKLGKRQPHVSAKVGIGAMLGGLAFLTVALGVTLTPNGGLLSAGWMILCYVCLGLGDLILQTSGMSATTKLAPRAFASQTMALWFAAMALSQGIQAQIVKYFDLANAGEYFGIQGLIIAGYGLFLVVLTPWMNKQMNIVG